MKSVMQLLYQTVKLDMRTSRSRFAFHAPTGLAWCPSILCIPQIVVF